MLSCPTEGLTHHLTPECLRGLFAEVDETLTAWDEAMVPLRHYIASRRLVNVASVLFCPRHQAPLVYPRLAPDTVVLEEGFTRDMFGAGCLGRERRPLVPVARLVPVRPRSGTSRAPFAL